MNCPRFKDHGELRAERDGDLICMVCGYRKLSDSVSEEQFAEWEQAVREGRINRRAVVNGVKL